MNQENMQDQSLIKWLKGHDWAQGNAAANAMLAAAPAAPRTERGTPDDLIQITVLSNECPEGEPFERWRARHAEPALPQAEQQVDKQAEFEAWLENYPIQIAGDDYELCFDAFQAGMAAQQAEREPVGIPARSLPPDALVVPAKQAEQAPAVGDGAQPLSAEQAARVRAVLVEAMKQPGRAFTLPEDAVASIKAFCGIGQGGE